MAVHFYAGVFAIQAVLPHMLARRKGHIVLVSSIDAKISIPPDAPYVAAKCALSGFGDVLRQELNGSGVELMAISPAIHRGNAMSGSNCSENQLASCRK